MVDVLRWGRLCSAEVRADSDDCCDEQLADASGEARHDAPQGNFKLARVFVDSCEWLDEKQG